MNNNSNAILIAGFAVLIIGIGMFTYTSARDQILVSSLTTSLSAQEIQAFNNNFKPYEGEQSGANVQALIGRLIANSNTYMYEPSKIPAITYIPKDKLDKAPKIENLKCEKQEDIYDYTSELGELRKNIQRKHRYNVNFEYGSEGFINKVIINY